MLNKTKIIIAQLIFSLVLMVSVISRISSDFCDMQCNKAAANMGEFTLKYQAIIPIGEYIHG